MVIEFGFSQLAVNRIEAEVMQGNIASEKLLGKCGFTNEGILREWMYWNNKHYDMTMFSLLRSDFKLAHTKAKYYDNNQAN
ncbi:MAG: GCN5-related N-acetyltransferase [Segetibacter sp.]|nr:GCN5-related N-acetyltransferase [Segetibacter sp.]